MENTQMTAGKTATEKCVGVTETQIKKGFEKAKTWADANKVIAKMSVNQVIEMRDALETTSKYSGLDMRQDFILTLLKYEVENRARKQEDN